MVGRGGGGLSPSFPRWERTTSNQEREKNKGNSAEKKVGKRGLERKTIKDFLLLLSREKNAAFLFFFAKRSSLSPLFFWQLSAILFFYFGNSCWAVAASPLFGSPPGESPIFPETAEPRKKERKVFRLETDSKKEVPSFIPVLISQGLGNLWAVVFVKKTNFFSGFRHIIFLYHLCVLIYLCISVQVVCCRRSTLNMVCSCFSFTTERRRQTGKRRREDRRSPEPRNPGFQSPPLSPFISLFCLLPMARDIRELAFYSDPGPTPENGKSVRFIGHFDFSSHSNFWPDPIRGFVWPAPTPT